MNSGLQAMGAQATLCKCCGAPAFLYGVVDFHKNCEIYRRKVLDLSGIPILLSVAQRTEVFRPV
jgi:hypothetical protein